MLIGPDRGQSGTRSSPARLGDVPPKTPRPQSIRPEPFTIRPEPGPDPPLSPARSRRIRLRASSSGATSSISPPAPPVSGAISSSGATSSSGTNSSSGATSSSGGDSTPPDSSGASGSSAAGRFGGGFGGVRAFAAVFKAVDRRLRTGILRPPGPLPGRLLQRRQVFFVGGFFEFALDHRQFFGGAHEFGVAVLFARLAEPLDALDHADVEVGDLGRLDRGFGGRFFGRPDRRVDLGADRVALADERPLW